MALLAQIIEIIPTLLISGVICVSIIICCQSIMDDCRARAHVKRRK